MTAKITLTWDNGSSEHVDQIVYRSTESFTVDNLPPVLARVGRNAREYIDTDIVTGNVYFYAVASENAVSEILLSSVISVTAESSDGDPHWDKVVSLLHFDGVDGSTTISDDSGRSWTVLGAAQVDTAQSKFGSGSLLLDGSTARITAASTSDFGFGTGDFTVEAWVRRGAADGKDCPIFEFRAAGAQNGLFYLSPTTRRLTYYNGTVLGNTGSAPAQDTWAHVAFSRANGVLRAFLDGVEQWSVAMAGNFGASRACAIGSNFAGSSFFNGSVDEARITKGVARYTENFTPPSEPFPNF